MPDLSKASRADKIKFVLFVVVFIGLVVLGIVLMPYFADLFKEETRAATAQELRDKGFVGVAIILVLQILQVVVAFIPGEVVQIMAGVIYGGLGGALICLLGVAIASAAVFGLVRRLGMPFVRAMVPEAQMERFGKYFKESKKLDMTVFILYLIPGLPKDVFTFFVPLTEMRFRRFLVLSLVGRFPALICSTFGGAAFVQGNYVQMILLFAICGGIAILGIMFSDRIMAFVNRLRHKGTTQDDTTQDADVASEAMEATEEGEARL